MLSFKPEVRIGLFDERTFCVLRVAAAWSLKWRVDVHATSIEDGGDVHAATSLHPFGLAVDLDVIGDSPPQRAALGEWLRRLLDPQYDVVLEADHVHVEWDAHRPALPKASP